MLDLDPDDEYEKIPKDYEKIPVDVRIIGYEVEKDYAPELASWSSWDLTGTETGAMAIQILPQDVRRHEAIVQCICNGSSGYVIIGKREQVMNSQGFVLAGGSNFLYKSQASAWMIAGGDAVTVSVLDQRYLR